MHFNSLQDFLVHGTDVLSVPMQISCFDNQNGMVCDDIQWNFGVFLTCVLCVHACLKVCECKYTCVHVFGGLRLMLSLIV